MRDNLRRRNHTLGVARTAAELAETYGIDPFLAEAAGLLHDWDKVLPDGELMARAAQYGIRVAGSPIHAVPLLHGPVAAHELPELFPELPAPVFQAVARHTVGATDMTPLDMVVFIADAIEPMRRGAYADDLRARVGACDLQRLFFDCFTQGLVYVMQTGRYLYPTALDIYNSYALSCAGKKG
ncbi:MAG: bis(5'-nucleosyl)-tetraphosphatase (symmetrical) YqeK [Collinsella sp.]|nr:bis(5'-nucleosyl)-tetraphosphatase (symmetrical) YqeK [Collinsella sp.]